MFSTVAHWFAHTVHNAPAQNGIVFAGVRYGYRDIARQVNLVAGWYGDRELQKGDVVALYLPNCMELVYAHFANMRLGLVTLPMNPAYQADELAYILDDAGARVVVTDRTGVQRLRELQGRLPHLRDVVVVDEGGRSVPGEDVLPFPEEDEETPTVIPEVDIEPTLQPEDTAIILYTSGTTGRPKGAVLSHKNICANMAAAIDAWEITAQERFLLTLPLFHAHGLILGLHGGAVFPGSLTVLHRKFDAEEALRDIRTHRCTMFYGVPTLYFRLLRSPLLDRQQVASMRLFTSGSAPLNETTWREFKERTGYEIVERYGLSETLFNTTNPLHGARVPGTVGQPFPGVEVRIVDKSGHAVPKGQAGEVSVRGDNVFKGYLNRPEATGEVLSEDGWFATGDMGRIRTEDGYLEILGRIKELIITGGYNVYPKEVESCLLEYNGVEECAVVGLPSEEWGETVHAVVVPKPGAQLDAEPLIEHAKQHLAPYKCPRSVTVAESLPRNAMGKVQKQVLKEQMQQD